MRRLVMALVLLALPLSLPAIARATDASPKRIVLRAGEAAFWEGPHVESSSGTESWSYEIEIAEPAYRLRVGIDHPEAGDNFTVTITPPE